MESFPNSADVFESDCWNSPASHELQSLKLLDIQKAHQQKLYASGLASKVFSVLSRPEQDAFSDTLPSLQKMMVFRRIFPNTPNQMLNMTFGVAFAIQVFNKQGEASTKYLRYAQVGDYIDGVICPRPHFGENDPGYANADRQLVYTLTHELIDMQQKNVLPDLKYNLTSIMTKELHSGPHPPLNY